MAITTYLSTINFNESRLNATIKRHKMAEWIANKDPHIYYFQETHFRLKTQRQLWGRK